MKPHYTKQKPYYQLSGTAILELWRLRGSTLSYRFEHRLDLEEPICPHDLMFNILCEVVLHRARLDRRFEEAYLKELEGRTPSKPFDDTVAERIRHW